jgi:UDP-glucuronate 4-epimerase
LTQQSAKTPVILVTGAAGFIGYHVCEILLKNGYTVLGVDNFDSFYPSYIKRHNVSDTVETSVRVKRLFKLYETDIRDNQKMRDVFQENKIEAVIHLAASVFTLPLISVER